MGPYCIFCNTRCFQPLPLGTMPRYAQDAYGTSTIAATCEQGKEFERKKIGFNITIVFSIMVHDRRPYTYIADGGDRRIVCGGCEAAAACFDEIKHEEWCTPQAWDKHYESYRAYMEAEQGQMRVIERRYMGGTANE